MTGKTLVLFRRNDLDAFYAAFTYWWLFGRFSNSFDFRAVDVFEDATRFIGTGNTVISIGLNLQTIDHRNKFYSYENDTTFTPLESVEGCVYYYNPNKALTELMFDSLFEAGHLDKKSDKRFQMLDQFFRFYRDGGFSFSARINERVLAYFQYLEVDDFVQLSQLIENPMSFVEQHSKRTPEDAVLAYIDRSVSVAMESEWERVFRIPSFINPTWKPTVRLINTDLVNHPAAKELFADASGRAILLYRIQANGVRVRYISSSLSEDALQVFENGSCVGNPRDSHWLISHIEWWSNSFGI